MRCGSPDPWKHKELSRGIERLLHDPREFLDNDPEYFRFILRILHKAY
jgi:hypothetical protein